MCQGDKIQQNFVEECLSLQSVNNWWHGTDQMVEQTVKETIKLNIHAHSLMHRPFDSINLWWAPNNSLRLDTTVDVTCRWDNGWLSSFVSRFCFVSRFYILNPSSDDCGKFLMGQMSHPILLLSMFWREGERGIHDRWRSFRIQWKGNSNRLRLVLLQVFTGIY